MTEAVSPTSEWVVPPTLTAEACEVQLSKMASSLSLQMPKSLVAGPGADGRLLALLASRRASDLQTIGSLRNVLLGKSIKSDGWVQQLENPAFHLLARYCDRLVEMSGADVQARVSAYQLAHRGISGLVTTTGGQSAVIDTNSVIGSGQSHTIFGKQPAAALANTLSKMIGARGSWTVAPRLVTYIAEVVENVREHASVGFGTDHDGLALFQVKQTNLARLSLVEKQLGSDTPFSYYLTSVRREHGHRFLGLVELSVSDSGPGIASSLAGRALHADSPDQELRYLLRAFEDNVSRKSTKGSGGGLPAMLEKMTQLQGAIHIRSGRWSLHRTSLPEDRGKTSNQMPWTTAQLPSAVGTNTVLLFPILKDAGK